VSGPARAGRGGIEIRCVDVAQVYHVDGEDVVALHDVQVQVAEGESVALFGPSGSGKSTLTSLLAGLRRPTRGEIWLGDHNLAAMSERQLLRTRGRQIGVVVQNPSRSLLPYGTGEDNILFAQRAIDRARRRTLSAPLELLRQLGLAELAGQRSARLSGGEQQRLSVAVAMAGAPQVLLADEPTSQLDSANRDLVVELLGRVTAEFGTTVVVVTHDPAVADATHRRVTLAEGRVADYGYGHPAYGRSPYERTPPGGST
jgi:ABC-type lipoprotein export system ATPase subunit